MQRRTFLTVTLVSAMGVPARAATRGGTLVYGRQTDCIYLDPVHTAQNADIWVIAESLRHADPADRRRKKRCPRPRIILGGQSGRQGNDLQAAAKSEVCRRLAAHRGGREVVAGARSQQGERRSVPVSSGIDRRRRYAG